MPPEPRTPQRPGNEGLRIGAKVRVLKDIWDDGEDCHPPGYLARKGEVLIVRRVPNWITQSIGVSHAHITDNSFTLFAGEYEPVPSPQTGELNP